MELNISIHISHKFKRCSLLCDQQIWSNLLINYCSSIITILKHTKLNTHQYLNKFTSASLNVELLANGSNAFLFTAGAVEPKERAAGAGAPPNPVVLF